MLQLIIILDLLIFNVNHYALHLQEEVIPVPAASVGINFARENGGLVSRCHVYLKRLDSRFHGNDEIIKIRLFR